MTCLDWKRTEHPIAARLGGERVSGRARGDAPEVAHPRLAVECKHKQALPAWLHAVMAQVVACPAVQAGSGRGIGLAERDWIPHARRRPHAR
jgi:hypothetical protein